jgi:hypothetical protein
MVKKRKPTELGKRLNDVRRIVGAKDLSAFYESLDGSRVKGFPSYASVCTYHGNPWRDPPTAYLKRIVETYPQVSMDWLVSGDGVAVRPELEEQRRIQRLRAAIFSAFYRNSPQLQPIGPVGHTAAETLVLASVPVAVQFVRGQFTHIAKRTDLMHEVAAGELGAAVAAPLTALGIDPAHWDEPFKAQYLAAVIPLLMTAMEGEMMRIAIERAEKARQESRDSAEEEA